MGIAESVDAIAASTGFSGVVRVDQDDESSFARAYGLADRGHRIPNTVDTRFGTASGTKGVTAVTVMTLVERGELDLTTTARSVLGDDLPLIDDGVNVEHLLAHRSGIGDYLDEEVVEAVTDYVLPVPVHRLAGTEDYVSVLAGHRQVSAPGERFSYNNSGFVVLALIAERVSGIPFERLVQESVCEPARYERHGVSAVGRTDAVVRLSGISMARGSEPTCCIFRFWAAETAASPRRRLMSADSGKRCSRAGSSP